MKNLKHAFIFLVAGLFFENLGFSECKSQSLFDEKGSYQGCLIPQVGQFLYQDSSQVSQKQCVEFCDHSDVHLSQNTSSKSTPQARPSGIDSYYQKTENSCAVSALKKGNSRFVQFEMSRPKITAERRRELAKGQKPNAIIVSCSDSRVPPELVLDQGIGDLFVIRTAGHVLGSAAVASIEYAFQNLGAKTIIVMGHESCGAVKATLSSPEGATVGSPSLSKMIETIRPHVQEFNQTEALDPLLEKPVKAHTEGTIRALMKRSEIIRKAVDSRKLEVLAAFASISSGEVTFWEVEISPEKKVKKPSKK